MNIGVGRAAMVGISMSAILGLAACGNPQYENTFNAAFEKRMKESCTTSAAKSGAPADEIEPYCTCFVGQFKGLSAPERVKLGPSSPKVQQAIDACRPK